VAQRVEKWHAFMRTSQALLAQLQQGAANGGGAAQQDAAAAQDVVSRTARVDDALLAALPRCLALATESVAEATTSQSARQAHYAEARSLPCPASGLPLTSAAGDRPELRPTATISPHAAAPATLPAMRRA
jgi:hypothetical protein